MRAGEFIQIIDVRGRQCSDFVAYNRAPLDRGLVRGIDNVTTRTLTRQRLSPSPACSPSSSTPR